MKICKVFITLCMVIGFSITSLGAKVAEVTQTNVAQVGISKEDAQVLFGTEKANVEVLTQKEMGETTGEFWWLIPVGMVALGCVIFGGCMDWNISASHSF